ncbi:UPF0687 protein C20orf27 homolog, partial [Amblyraja radiata]|uniref:UPF0687 protein C20orf27 homolog n=1 Tax=Amblyraja radiata TaxID=386614 RepID=UPI001403917A
LPLCHRATWLGYCLRNGCLGSTNDLLFHSDPGHRMKCEYMAHKEGVIREEMLIASELKDSASVKVTLQARVLDRLHGTPMLLEGVKCIGSEPEYDSEQSDWQGFD